MASFNTGVFEKGFYGSDTLSARAFYLLLGIVLTISLGGTTIVASAVAASGIKIGTGTMLLAGLLIPVIGIFVVSFAGSAIGGFIGVNIVSLSFGVLLSVIAQRYSPHLIANACMATACVTVTMMCFGSLYPNVFRNLGGALFVALIGLLFARILQMFIPTAFPMHALDWVGAAIFSLYIGYDWNRASEVSKTARNAMWVALDLYLDIVNLFAHLLGLSSDD